MLWIFFWVSFVVFGSGHCSISWCDTSLAVIMWESWKRDFYIFRIKTSLSAKWICCKKRGGEWTTLHVWDDAMQWVQKIQCIPSWYHQIANSRFYRHRKQIVHRNVVKTESNSEKIKLLWSRYLHIIFRNPDVVKHTRDHHHPMKTQTSEFSDQRKDSKFTHATFKERALVINHAKKTGAYVYWAVIISALVSITVTPFFGDESISLEVFVSTAFVALQRFLLSLPWRLQHSVLMLLFACSASIFYAAQKRSFFAPAL